MFSSGTAAGRPSFTFTATANRLNIGGRQSNGSPRLDDRLWRPTCPGSELPPARRAHTRWRVTRIRSQGLSLPAASSRWWLWAARWEVWLPSTWSCGTRSWYSDSYWSQPARIPRILSAPRRKLTSLHPRPGPSRLSARLSKASSTIGHPKPRWTVFAPSHSRRLRQPQSQLRGRTQARERLTDWRQLPFRP
jgi:hypothetical protein